MNATGTRLSKSQSRSAYVAFRLKQQNDTVLYVFPRHFAGIRGLLWSKPKHLLTPLLSTRHIRTYHDSLAHYCNRYERPIRPPQRIHNSRSTLNRVARLLYLEVFADFASYLACYILSRSVSGL
jgi:hypothetical protein